MRQLTIPVHVVHGNGSLPPPPSKNLKKASNYKKQKSQAVVNNSSNNNNNKMIGDIISPEQRKSTNLELANMELSTAQIISSSPSEINNATISKVRFNIHNWISRWNLHFRPSSISSVSTHPSSSFKNINSKITQILGIANSEMDKDIIDDQDDDYDDESLYSNYRVQYSTQLIDYILQIQNHPDPQSKRNNTVERIIEVDGKFVLANLIEAYLIPCRFGGNIQTYATGAAGYNCTNLSTAPYNDNVDTTPNTTNTTISGRLGVGYLLTSSRTILKPSTWKLAVFHTSCIVNVMDVLHQDSSNSLRPYMYSSNTILKVGLKLSMLLTYYNL